MVNSIGGLGFGGGGSTLGGAASGTQSTTPGRGSSTIPIPTLGSSAANPNQGAVGNPVAGNNAVTGSAYGAPIPIGFGTMRLAGNVIWARPLEPVPVEEVNTAFAVLGRGEVARSVLVFDQEA